MQSAFDYLKSLFDVFFKWWWAVVTGLFTIGSVLFSPPSGVTLGGTGIGLLVLLVSSLFFLVVSMLVVSWRWYISAHLHPSLVELIPAQPKSDTPLTFIVRAELPLSPGNLLAVFRTTEHDVEVCAAILEVKGPRKAGTDWQAEPKWIRQNHQSDFQEKRVKTANIRLRPVDGDAVALVEKCIREQNR